MAAMVNTGSQLSIIPRSVLHQVGRHLRRQGKPVRKLEPASVTLYGKNGAAGKHELNVTAQVCLPVETGGAAVQTIFFVQPDSSQKCLLEHQRLDCHFWTTKVNPYGLQAPYPPSQLQ